MKKPNELLANKLLSGTAFQASRAAVWWPAHSTDLSVALFSSHDEKLRIARTCSVKDRAIAWDSLVQDPFRLMEQHAEIETALVEASVRKDRLTFDRFSKTLELNMYDQLDFYRKKREKFPIYTFQDLFYEHMAAFLNSLTHLSPSKTARQQLSRCSSRLSMNAVHMGALLTEWI